MLGIISGNGGNLLSGLLGFSPRLLPNSRYVAACASLPMKNWSGDQGRNPHCEKLGGGWGGD